ncbi:putative alcohol dehydrogenase [Desulfamplus magnetovallimortis]|uniref:Putative alcohol dehydrogenase n=1 Tax=Desulfamplus magnetovallimortis TaxID=1246637 RepID=A0A1W1H613_9BACT|nr:iron-containing alcohol dehydrogenase [Desulfamplus magnetovallimortis]SLM27884.1 putative alcohol dehydrogenase [Desulfamplus magnetovallimortis]
MIVIPDYYEFYCGVNIVAGHDVLERIPELLGIMGADAPMILTDKGVKLAGLADILTKAIGNDISIKTIEDDVPPDSDLNTVNNLAGIYREKGCDSIIALGGGSVLDTAKGVNILVSEKSDNILDFKGSGALKHKLKPLIAVPTTAGTGSEVTMAAVIADKANDRKLLFGSLFLLPDAAVIDSRMTMTLPPHITALTAMDALTHAVEASYCLGRNPLSDSYAHEAIEMINRDLLKVLKTPDDKDGRLALATAATMAGIAFSNSPVGMVHTLGHSVGSVCHAPHGTCMAILLPYGMEYNMHKREERIGEILLPLAGPDIFAATPFNLRAEKAVAHIRKLNQELSVATGGIHGTSLGELKDRDGNKMVLKEKLPDIAKTAMGDGTLFYNPEDMDYEDFLMVLEAAYEGVPLDRSRIKCG